MPADCPIRPLHNAIGQQHNFGSQYMFELWFGVPPLNRYLLDHLLPGFVLEFLVVAASLIDFGSEIMALDDIGNGTLIHLVAHDELQDGDHCDQTYVE